MNSPKMILNKPRTLASIDACNQVINLFMWINL
jgi:hypothetical protein